MNEWTDGPSSRRRLFVAAGFSAFAGICAFYIFMDCGDAQIAGNWVETSAALFAIPFMTIRLVRFYHSAPADAARIEISVSDDGRGFDSQSEPAGGRGLASMKRRAFTIGATLSIESSPRGTCIRILLPA